MSGLATIIGTHRLGDGLFRVTTGYPGKPAHTALWTHARLRKRPRDCEVCGATMSPGTWCFLPISNSWFRMWRLCLDCVERP